MTTASNTKTRKLQQQLNEVIRQSGELLELSDLKTLSLALATVAAEKVKADGAFAEQVHTLYQEIADASSEVGKAAKSKQEPDRLVPIKPVPGREIGIVAPLDPYFLQELYGDAQLPAALSRYTLKKLLEGAEKVGRMHPGTKPQNRSKKDSVIEYIVAFVTTSPLSR